MKKRFLVMTIAASIVCSFCASCSFSSLSTKGNFEGTAVSEANTTSFIEAPIQNFAFDGHILVNDYPRYDAFGAYSLLNDNQKSLWKAYFDIWNSRELNKTYDFSKMTRAEIDTVNVLFISQFPAGTALSFGYKDSESFSQDKTYSGVYLEGLNYDNTSRVDELYLIASDILESIECDGTDESKAYAIAKWVANNITYTTEKTSDLSIGYISGLYNAIIYRQADSSGFAKAYTYLCTLAGLNAINVYGSNRITNEDYEWNMISIDNNWYHVDTSMMTTDNYYRYFKLTDGEILVDHSTSILYTDFETNMDFIPATPLAN